MTILNKLKQMTFKQIVVAFLIKINPPVLKIMSYKSSRGINKILKGYNHSNSFKKNYNKIVKDKIPWMTYPFIDYIKNLDISDKTLFEYGSGYSTIFWAENCKHVTSVEDYKQWYNKLEKELPKNSTLLLRTEKLAYINSVGESKKKYDIIVLDGMKYRTTCAQVSIDKLNDGGMIILDDSDNIFYNKISNFLKSQGLIQIDFVGLKPFSTNILATSIYIKRDYNFKSKYSEIQPKIFVGEQRNYEA